MLLSGGELRRASRTATDRLLCSSACCAARTSDRHVAGTLTTRLSGVGLSEQNLERQVADRLLAGVLLLKATALALREVPELNAIWDSGTVVTKEAVHLGVAITLRRGGLIAPAIHDAGRRTFDQLMKSHTDLTQRARAGGLRSSELSDPPITVTSLGERGVDAVFGVIHPPQDAIAGFGRIVERPWAEAGGLFARPVVMATLSADHRVSDGHRGGLFLSAIDRLLQEPDKL